MPGVPACGEFHPRVVPVLLRAAGGGEVTDPAGERMGRELETALKAAPESVRAA